MDDATLTLQEAADQLGVHYMTAYRYVRLGSLEAVKSGGTWRVQRSAVQGLLNGVGNSPVKRGERAPWASRLESRLVAGDARGAWGVMESAMAAGAELSELYLDVLTPAMVSIGDRWSQGELDIAIEHRASGIAMRIIGQIGPRFTRRGRSRGTIVLTTPAGESHALPIAILGDLLRLEGWDVSDLGADLPAASLLVALEDTPDVAAVGLSVTSSNNLERLVDSCRAVREAHPDLLVLVGGRAIQSVEQVRELGGHEWAVNAQQVQTAIEEHKLSVAPQP